MKRVLIIGICGAGKSTLSKKLSKSLNLEVYHLDKEFWLPNWVMPPTKQWLNKLQSLLDKPSWIIEGNYANSLAQRLSKCDTVIYLNYPRRIAFFRVFKRVIKSYGKVREDMAEGCKEHFSFAFLKHIWNFPKTQTPIVEKALQNRDQSIKLFEFKSSKELEKFLKSLTKS